MIGAPFLVLGLLLVLGALVGAQVAGRDRGAVASFVLSPLHPATWRATAAIVLGFWVELFALVLVLAAFSSGTSLLFVGIGFVFVGLAIEGCRLVARAERWRAALADRRPLLPHAYRPYGSGLRDLILAVFLDISRWRDVVYVFVAFPLTVLEFVVSVGLWTASILLLCVPVWYVTTGLPDVATGFPALSPGAVLAAGLVGLGLAPVAASVSRGLMALHRAVVAGLLCDSERRALERRVETLEGSRKAVLDVEASELRRIERDLHDGAQQRLVMLTIDLSLAAERIDTDPAAARELLVEARDQARLALAELRDLVRGVAPAILMDRGLVPALSAIAGRCPVPTVVVSTLPDGHRLPDAAERAAYFVVAEALANVAKHASATRCEVRCRAEARGLVVEVWDDGAGGARVVPGGGLAGLAGRVEALDGSLTVESPAGGPTTIRAEIPVATVPAAVGWPAGTAPAAPVTPAAGSAAPVGQEPR
ncbi:MAG TPA: sensor domain-containing protein [Patescibacteria group bacterium]|nr:sensor domain-containing protein [Patescibacteria group bacterium]